MRLSQARIIISKEFKQISRRKSIIYAVVLAPLLIAIAFPVLLWYLATLNSSLNPTVIPVINAFSMLFVLVVAALPQSIATYSLAGEKLEKSLEPLLATPTTDGEILFGKTIAAFVPPYISTVIGTVIYMILIDVITASPFGYLYFPNWYMGIIMLFVAPLAIMLVIEVNILISSRVSDVRAAQQWGALPVVPFFVLYFVALIGIITLDTNFLLSLSVILAIIDFVLYFVSVKTFHREEILTKWK